MQSTIPVSYTHLDVYKRQMPTVLQNVKELQEAGIVEEVGEYESTGGRKAKALSVVKNVRYAAGVDITANHISVVIIDLKGDMVHSRRFRRRFENTAEYYDCLLYTSSAQMRGRL